ncbi:hypothetical protein GWI34_00890 [Actinomadura sp. DSM 109109]|nr:hypothetical protein [Actinomadura lepetitiana]
MNDGQSTDLELRFRHAVSIAVWPMVGSVLGTLIGLIIGFLIGGSVPLSLGIAIGAFFAILGTIAGVAFTIWFEARIGRSRPRKQKAA